MDIFFTLDYEIYSGDNPGTPQKCMIEPSDALIRIGDKYGVKFVFFVDIGYILKLGEYRHKYSTADHDYKIILDQIESVLKEGHDVQLHIHPHWEDCRYTSDGWQMDTHRFSLLNFNEQEIEEIVTRYTIGLRDIAGENVFAYRAGGWCMQPFNRLYHSLKENSVWLDSTVYQEGYHHSDTHFFDFRGAPAKTEWRFEEDPLIEVENGYFTEVPIASYRVNPLFFWKYAFSKKLSKGVHKPFGDGQALPAAKSDLIYMLTRFSHSVVSIDGYKSSFLHKALNKYMKEYGEGNFVTIGHPKGITPYSLQKLEYFLAANRGKHNFTTFIEKYSN
ncbi:MAG: hypothetical protein B6D59_05335 [Campylobacteraceae bacterium 4484_4]|nr:MAG: hypothetical protein B6D59_05335 [Campylobacteraceae bacterium 4484_4]